MLKLITATPVDMSTLWYKAFCNALKDYSTSMDETKAIISGVKYINASREKFDQGNMKEIQKRYDFIQCIMLFMAWQTPKRLMQLFPPEKRYDGNGEWKNYFTTMEYLRTLEVDKPFMQKPFMNDGDERKVFNFLFEYQNLELDFFVVEIMSNIESMSHLRGQPGPMDKLIDDMGITRYYLEKDEATGQEYLLNSDTGKSVPVSTGTKLKLVQ